MRPDARSVICLAATLATVVFAPCLSAQIAFTDVSAAAGVDGDFYRSDTGHSLGVNWIDFNLDGWPDLFLVGGGLDRPPVLFENRGDGTFSRANHLLPTLPGVEMSGSRFADIDRDGDLDIFIYTDHPDWEWIPAQNPLDGPANLLLRNLWVESNGTAQPLFVEDAVGTGLQDLAEVPYGDLPGHRAKTAAFFDYDRDGCIDLFVGHMVLNHGGHEANRDRLFRNRCDGTFEDRTDALGLSDAGPGDATSLRGALASAAFHLDGDLWSELIVIHITYSQSSLYLEDFIFKNEGPAEVPFREILGAMAGVGDDAQAGMGVDTADVDLDGDWDLYITDIYNTTLDAEPLGNVYYEADGTGGYSDNSAPSLGIEADNSWGVNFFDADLDGFEDLYVATIAPNPREFFFRNDGLEGGVHAGFTNIADQIGYTTGNSRGSAVADYDRDGDLDFAVVNQNGPLQLFRNDSVTSGHWLALELQGTVSSPDAIGTLVEARTGSTVRRRQVKGGSSAHSQDSLTVHFGFGDAERVDELLVRWPSGRQTRLFDVELDRYLVIAEGPFFEDGFESGDVSAWSQAFGTLPH